MKRLRAVPDLPDLSGLSEEVLWCRTDRHWWKWQRDSVAQGDEEFDRVLVCARCGAEKTKTISLVSFTITKRHSPHYPEGYLIKGSGRIPISEVYREQYERRHRSRRQA